MDGVAVEKTCRSCGVDLHHKERHKSRDGTYICPTCVKAKSSLGHSAREKSADTKFRPVAMYAILAAIVGVLLWAILDIISQIEF
jgi:hypothetical protein